MLRRVITASTLLLMSAFCYGSTWTVLPSSYIPQNNPQWVEVLPAEDMDGHAITWSSTGVRFYPSWNWGTPQPGDEICWLYGSTSQPIWWQGVFNTPSTSLRIQIRSGDDNDGWADVLVDGVLEFSYYTRNVGNAVIIGAGLSNTAHTVKIQTRTTGSPDDVSFDYVAIPGEGPTGACCDGTTGICTDDAHDYECTGDQQEWHKGLTCAEIVCEQHTGACCHGTTGICEDDVLPGDCQGEQDEWYKGLTCAQIVCEQHTGACCHGTTGICEDDVLPGDCQGDQDEWYKGLTCAQIVCEQHTGACCHGTTGICEDDVLPGDCQGDQDEWYKGLTCAQIVCEEHTGACCDHDTTVCVDYLTEGECEQLVPDPVQREWSKGVTCAQVGCEEHTGACCYWTAGVCLDHVVEADCRGGKWFKRTLCDQLDPPCVKVPVPTISQRGLMLLTLLAAGGLMIRFGRRRSA